MGQHCSEAAAIVTGLFQGVMPPAAGFAQANSNSWVSYADVWALCMCALKEIAFYKQYCKTKVFKTQCSSNAQICF